MADSYTEEIQKKLDSLPANIRDFIYSADMDKLLQQVGAKHNLHIDQIGNLETETVSVMMGVTQPEEFVNELVENLNLDTTKASAVAKDVNDLIFVKIRESMKKGGAAAPVAPPPPPTAPKPPVTPAPPPKPPVPAAPAAPAAPVAPPTPPRITAADLALTQKTVVAPKPIVPAQPPPAAPKPPAPPSATASAPKPQPPKPGAYTADPYREPPE